MPEADMDRLPFDPHALAGPDWMPALAAYALALVLSLALAARFTPRHWWRRPTLRGGAVLAGGTLLFGTGLLVLLAMLVGRTAPAPASDTPLAALAAAVPKTPGNPPVAGARYRVAAQLNLRSGSGVKAARLGVLRAGSRVVASGAADGDWWQVRAEVDGREQTGWTSSLWLRRIDER
jgi:hypothetical protein